MVTTEMWRADFMGALNHMRELMRAVSYGAGRQSQNTLVEHKCCGQVLATV